VKHTNNEYDKRQLKHMTTFTQSSIAAKTVCVRKLVGFITNHILLQFCLKIAFRITMCNSYYKNRSIM